MKFHNSSAEIYVPDNTPEDLALARTTHMGIGAHQDDLEIMAYSGILECFERKDKHFTGITVTDGGGSPRTGPFSDHSDDEMKRVRREEQIKAANIGQYGAMALLNYTSDTVKDGSAVEVVEDLKSIIGAASPDVVYTHNPADKHDTHVAVMLRVVRAIRELPITARPSKLYGCEVWRDLDWLCDEDKVAFAVDGHEDLAEALLGAFESQISGGKRYDLAAIGRRRAHATYFASHATDRAQAMIFAMDLTPLIDNTDIDVSDYVGTFINRFAQDVIGRISRLG